jgi:hypothetical protein
LFSGRCLWPFFALTWLAVVAPPGEWPGPFTLLLALVLALGLFKIDSLLVDLR